MEIFNAETWRDKRTAASSRLYELVSAGGVLSGHVEIFNVMVAQLCCQRQILDFKGLNLNLYMYTFI